MRYIIVLITMTLSLVVRGQQKELTIPFSNPSGAKSLDINLMSGNIKVIGTDRSDVFIQYEIEERKNDDDHKSDDKSDDKSKGMKKIGGGNFEFEIGESKNEVYVKSQNWMNMINLEIEVPREIAVDIKKQMGEDVIIVNVKGDVNVENNIGSVYIRKISGAVNASSSTGELKVEFEEIDPDQSMTFNTITGGIDITLPPSYKADLKMRTQWGDIFSDLNVTTTENNGQSVKQLEGSGMKVVSNNWTYGTLNGGGPEMIIKTQMGSIYLRGKE